MMSASATVFATIKRFITFRLLENQIYENRLEYAYSARRFLPLISLNVFGGRINQPLKQTITHIAEWSLWGVNLVPWTNWNVECTRGARGEDSNLT